MQTEITVRSEQIVLDFSGVELTENSMTITSREGFEQAGAALARMDSSGCWYWADYILYAEEHGLKTVLEGSRTDLHRSTIYSYVETARLFPIPDRVKGVSFSHHAAAMYVLGKDATLEKAKKWLEVANEQGFTVGELREAIRLSKRKGEDDPGPMHNVIRITDFVKLSKWSSSVSVKDVPQRDRDEIRKSTEALFSFLCEIHRKPFII